VYKRGAGLGEYLIDDLAGGTFEVSRRVFTAPELFELEMKYIFEQGWTFLGMESQFPKPHDFYCTAIGRQPVILTRNAQGEIRAFLNTCRHKGARLCHTESGHAELFVCPYHAWTYDSNGANRSIKDKATGGYSAAFDGQDHDLKRLARLESYRGLVFGSLNPEVPPLEDFLGDTRRFIDLIMDQGEQGMELVPGRTVYTYNGNWKLQVENGTDSYHLTVAHTSFIKIVSDRRARNADRAAIRSRDFTRSIAAPAGVFTFAHGHCAIWIENQTPEQKPLYQYIDRVRARVGDERAQWMLNFRNLVVFPNLQLADSESLLLRVIRPISVDQTEMRLYCLAPVGEPAEARTMRIRQHEDFFNVSGLATPDDAVIYEDCQFGYGAREVKFQQAFARGMSLLKPGPSKAAVSLGIDPEASIQDTFRVQPEVHNYAFYKAWREAIEAGLRRDGTTA
jgi:benzoate/toluate 1,2-dioxygenase alpha subunit